MKMPSALPLGLTITIIGLASSCGMSLSTEKKSSNSEWNYRFIENGCDTGEHKFEKKEDYCFSLRDDRTNRNCASRMRQEAASKDCGQ